MATIRRLPTAGGYFVTCVAAGRRFNLGSNALQSYPTMRTMTRRRKWLVAVAALAGLLLIGFAILVSLMPSSRELAATASEKLSAALGVQTRVGAVNWTLLPSPAVVVEELFIAQPKPITARRITLYPDLGALWDKRIRFNSVLLDGAVIPQLSLRGLGSKAPKNTDPEWALDALPLQRAVFTDVTWISRRGIPVIYAGEADFDPHWRPRTARLERPGFRPRTDLTLTRQGQDDRWTIAINLGGGTANGQASLQTSASGAMKLAGKLRPRDVEVAGTLQAFNRRPAISGKATGETTLSAEGDDVLDLAQSLNTKTPFVMGPSQLLRFDLDKAIRTVGKEHAGQTPLDTVTGLLETQNTPDGMVSYFRSIRATSGSLTAAGDARLFNRQVEAEFAVDLVDGVVGVPLKVSGPTNDIKVSVPGGAVAGAVIGTVLLPGIGTAIGARIGAGIGKLFGSSPATSGTVAKPSTKPSR
ncbi:MAG: hypothetical protein V4614_04565 [Pseudomonadota bacterium]